MIFSEEDNYIYSTDNREKLEQEMQALNYRRKGGVAENLPLPFPTVGAVRISPSGAVSSAEISVGHCRQADHL